MKNLWVAVLVAVALLFAGSTAYAASTASKHTVLNVKLHNGANVVKAGKMSYVLTVTNGKVISVKPQASSSAKMGGMQMSNKTIKLTSTTKNGLCYYCWVDYWGYEWCVWVYC